MNKYLVRFTTKGGEHDKEWCYANNEREAAQNILDELWGISSIDYVEKL